MSGTFHEAIIIGITVAVVGGLTLAATLSFFRFVKWFIEWRVEVDDSMKRVDEMAVKIDALSDNVRTLTDNIRLLLEKVNELINHYNRDGEQYDQISLSKSPRKLHELGKKVFKKLDGGKIIEKYYDRIDMPEGINPYRIEEASIQFALSELGDILTDEEHDLFENTAYDNGIDKKLVYAVLALKFRDKWLEKRNLA